MRLCHPRQLSFGIVFALSCGWLSSIGCGTQRLDSGDQATCHSDAECGADQRCAPIAGPGNQPQVVPPCMVAFSYCTESADCSNGEVCWPSGRTSLPLPGNCFPTGRLCGPPCSVSDLCWTDEVCEASGECRLPPCSEANAVACPAHWRCAPDEAEAGTVQPVAGANEMDSPNYGRDALRGCARIRCDEAGGFTCKDGWVCDPERATDPSGCKALPCAEAGHCSNDASFICEPTSSGSRPMGSDVHGCVPKNCEEGRTCQRLVDGVDVGYCDFEGPFADTFGCASRRCDEPGSLCNSNLICEPGSARADARGCRPMTCAEGVSCGSLVCDPSHASANARGCVAATNTGGMGGAGASGGGGASGGRAGSGAAGQNAQGGSSSAGRTGESGGSGAGAAGGSSGTTGSAGKAATESVGRCVDR
jgi:hypothetical protein